MASAFSYKDLLPLPAENTTQVEPGAYQPFEDMPTESHALATAEPKQKGAAQLDHPHDVKDLGWNEPEDRVEAPLVGGMDNDEVWVLIRRFNKQIRHVKEYPLPVPGNLDLNIAEEEEFSPDKLRSNLERFYMTIVIGGLIAVKHVARLRSWRETKRTAIFCGVYFLAWFLDLIVPLFSALSILLIVYPKSRGFLFPPAPIALVDSSTGGIQKPKAGVLGSNDSATGASENHKGEAVEQEASNFVNSIASVAISSAAGKRPEPEAENGEDSIASDIVPDPSSIATATSDAKDKAHGKEPSPKHDKTKVPMETAMWTKMRPLMTGIAGASDVWERLGNALDPTPPFPRDRHRVRLALLIVPVFCVSLFTTSYMFVKGTAFAVGFGFFGDPIMTPALQQLNKRFPNWTKLLEVRNTILKGVPTNAQLAITLLRIGEANNAPLPPPPRMLEAPPDVPVDISDKEFRATGAEPPLNATKEELDEAMAHDPAVPHETSGSDIEHSMKPKHGKKGSKILGFFKSTAKATVQTAVGADTLKAKTGSEHAKNRLGAIPPRNQIPISGPVEFDCRYHGHKGKALLTHLNGATTLLFVRESTGNPEWTTAVPEIRELRKIGGYGWKAKLVIGWAMGREVSDALEVIDRAGNAWKLTAMPLRDELFNRLIAMCGQKWESW